MKFGNYELISMAAVPDSMGVGVSSPEGAVFLPCPVCGNVIATDSYEFSAGETIGFRCNPDGTHTILWVK